MQTWAHGRLAIAPWQTSLDQLAALGLTAVDGMTQVWLVDEKGLFGGAEAINRALKQVWWARPFTYLYPLSGIKQIQNRVYRWVAANRHRLPGHTTSCETTPPKNWRTP